MTLKIRLSPKSNQLFPSTNNVSMQVWTKSIYQFQRQRTKTLFRTFQSVGVTLKIKSRSPKFDVLILPTMYLCMFDQIHPLVQKIIHGNHISDISKCHWDLENKFKVTKLKSNQLIPPSQQCIYARLVNLSEDNGWKRIYADVDGIRTKNNILV